MSSNRLHVARVGHQLSAKIHHGKWNTAFAEGMPQIQKATTYTSISVGYVYTECTNHPVSQGSYQTPGNSITSKPKIMCYYLRNIWTQCTLNIQIAPSHKGAIRLLETELSEHKIVCYYFWETLGHRLHWMYKLSRPTRELSDSWKQKYLNLR